MSRTVVFVTSMLFLIAARVCDIVSTFHFNRSLSREGNPVFLLLGGGETSLLIITSVFPLLSIAGLILFLRGRSLAWNKRPSSLGSFICDWLQRVAFDRQPFSAYLWGNAHAVEGLQALRLFGVALAWALNFGSAAAVYAWVAIFKSQSPVFLSIFSMVSIGRFSLVPSLIAVSGFLVGAWLFFLSEYAEIRKDNTTGGKSVGGSDSEGNQ
jgi:hypothetical protein